MATENHYLMLWKQATELLRDEIGASYDIWFSQVQYSNFQNGTLHVMVPNVLTKEWIKARYLNHLENFLFKLGQEQISISINILGEKAIPLNDKYTFDSFVVGNSNRFAHAACYAVGDAPARAYNPLFIYGGVGLGKTHLMQAIGHRILENNPSFSVVYVSSETFANELISSIKDGDTVPFRNKFRNVDVLLIDDIQFLAGKERTQEEFFHTFNSLYESNRQLVISSDRPPRSIPTLEDRLRSRFEWGLIADIQIPDFETRVAILRKKAQEDELDTPYDVLDYIANSIDSNIRELEGALVRLVAYATITDRPLNMDTAIEALKEILPPIKTRQITIEMIQKEVCKYYEINLTEMLSKKRNKQLVYPRQVAMYICRHLLDASYPIIGDQFGGRDHTTVMHACEKIGRDMKDNPTLMQTMRNLYQQIGPDLTI